MKYKLQNIYLLIFSITHASKHGEQHNTHEKHHLTEKWTQNYIGQSK